MTLLHKLTQRKAPKRKNGLTKAFHEESGDSVVLNLGDMKFNFNNGQWIPQLQTTEELNEENEATLRVQIRQITEERDLLVLKFNILLDMLTREVLRQQPRDFSAIAEDNFFCCDLESKTKD